MSAPSSFRLQRKRNIKAEINVVPFIDVMLVLLIIFMITVPVIHHSVKVDLPEEVKQPEQTKSQVSKGNEIIIQVMAKHAVDDQQRYQVKMGQNEAQVFAHDDAGFQALSEHVALLRAGKSDEESPIIVFGDKAAEYGDVVGLFLRLKGEQVKSVKLATQPAKQQATKP